MHIPDQVLPSSVWIGGTVVTGVATGCVLARLREADIPRTAVLTSVFFAVSWIHIPVGIGSAHLMLNGLTGIVLGWLSLPAILIGLGFQLLLFGFGGITTLGINTLNLAAGALAAHGLFAARAVLPKSRARDVTAGFVAAAVATLVSALLYFTCLLSAGEAFRAAARYAFLLHLPVLGIEGVVTGSAVAFLTRVNPSLLAGRAA